MAALLSTAFLSGQVARLAAHPCWRYFDAVARRAVLSDLARVLRSECKTEEHARLTIGYFVEHPDQYSQFPSVTNLREVAKQVDPNRVPPRKPGCPRCTSQPIISSFQRAYGSYSRPGWISYRMKDGYTAVGRCQCSPFFTAARDVPRAEDLDSEEGLAA